MSQKNFDNEFSRSGDPENAKCVAFRKGFNEILQSCAKSVHEKFGCTNGIKMVKDWISDKVMMLLEETVNECNFEMATTVLSKEREINNESKYSLFNENGTASLKDKNEIANELNADLTDDTSGDLIEDCFIELEKVETCEIENDSDSSDSVC